jgi:hypothetical protein
MYETNKFFERFLKFFPKNCPKSRKGTTGKKLENGLKCKEKGKKRPSLIPIPSIARPPVAFPCLGREKE